MIGKILTELRNQKGMTQEAIADALGVKRPRYNAWERNGADPSIDMLLRLADYHKVSTDFLLGRVIESSEAIKLPDEEWKARALIAEGRLKQLKKNMLDLINEA